MINKYPVHSNVKLGIIDRNYKLMSYRRADFRPYRRTVRKNLKLWEDD